MESKKVREILPQIVEAHAKNLPIRLYFREKGGVVGFDFTIKHVNINPWGQQPHVLVVKSTNKTATYSIGGGTQATILKKNS